MNKRKKITYDSGKATMTYRNVIRGNAKRTETTPIDLRGEISTHILHKKSDRRRG